ncbi:unnamed protein product [Alopecurus aequalis]
MGSRTALALLRAQFAHPLPALPISAWIPRTASSATGHGLFPLSSPLSLATSGSAMFVRFREESEGGYPQVVGIVGDRMMEMPALRLNMDMTYIAGGSVNENERLRKLILLNLYPVSTISSISADAFLPTKSKAAEKPSYHFFPVQPLARSFSSQVKFDEDAQSEELKRIGNAVEEILKLLKENLPNTASTAESETTAEILKLLKENLPKKSSTTAGSLEPKDQDTPPGSTTAESLAPKGQDTAPGSTTAESLEPEGQDPPPRSTTPESMEPKGQDNPPPNQVSTPLAHITLIVLQEAINMAKNPDTKAALDRLVEERDIWRFFEKAQNKLRWGEEKKDDAVVADSENAALEQLMERIVQVLALVEQYYSPLVIVEIVAGVVIVLAQITW